MAVLILGILVAGAATGCQRGQPKRIWSRSQAEDVLLDALQAELPDQRRQAVERVACSRFIADDLSIKTLAVIIRSDTSPMVRRAAARALGHSGRQAAYESLTEVLVAGDSRNDSTIQTPNAMLQRACLEAMDDLRTGAVAPPEEDVVLQPIIQTLRGSRDRDVKIAAVRLLRHFERREVLTTLIDMLRYPEFAVAYEARHSLYVLTGEHLDMNYDTWRGWLERNGQPFADAGVRGPSSRPRS